ncbi:MAG TPA: amino acid ABC transporter permease, partial [Candidatus Thermoplasmatota archaeon]|nr:amino acid ABC transporter permease [Candidatus Thermoplasmatota archaeon]
VWLVLPVVGIRLPIFWAGAVALLANTAAYQAEAIRAGIQGVQTGQMEAALSLGFTHPQAMRHVVLPQAFRTSLPALGNEIVILLKDTSLVSVIGVVELTQVGRIFSARTFLVLETWLGVAAIYLVLTYTLALVLRRLEVRVAIPGLGVGGSRA